MPVLDYENSHIFVSCTLIPYSGIPYIPMEWVSCGQKTNQIAHIRGHATCLATNSHMQTRYNKKTTSPQKKKIDYLKNSSDRARVKYVKIRQIE